MNQCEVCQKPAQNKCGGCYNVYYCSKQHQKDSWRKHKKSCRPFKVTENANLGRHLVATRSIKSGEVILQEPPLIWGPSQNTIPVCLGCGKGIDESNSRPCTKCGWPVCGDLCEKAPAHLPECRYTIQRGNQVTVRNFGINHPIYRCVIVLRCLYQKQFLSKVGKKLDNLESHCEARRTTTKYEHDRIAIGEFIRRFFKLGAIFTEEEIMRISGIVRVNSHEVPLTDPPHIAIYGIASLFEHNCVANCTKSFTNGGNILITSAKAIEEGENLSICYTDSLWGTLNRRYFLNETKYFWCHCSRCLDTTEFGTNFNSIKCQNPGCAGYLLPQSFTATSNTLPDWHCDKCPKSMTPHSIHDILERIGRDLQDLDRDSPKSCRNFIETYEGYLHKNHFYMTDVKIVLLHLLGQESGLTQLSLDDLMLKTELCQNLIGLLKKIAPAEKRTLGMILFELHAASAENARRKGEVSGNTHEMRFCLMESKRILEEAVDLLRYEPDALPEGKVYLQAKQNLKDIDVVLRNAHSDSLL